MPMLTSTPPIPLHQTFHLLSKKLWEMSEWMQRVSYSTILEESHLFWCWASNGQFSLCSSSPVGLFRVCSSRVVVVHLAHFACTTVQRWVPSDGSNEKNLILVEDSWASCPLVFHEVGRDAFCNLAPHFVWFLLPLILHLSPPSVGTGFSQDKVTWLQWNSGSFPFVVPLLSVCLWCGLHLSLLKGLPQLVMQLSDVVVKTLVFLCAPYCGEIEVNRKMQLAHKHQIMWAVPGNGWSCGVVSMYQLGQMPWPVCLPVLI